MAIICPECAERLETGALRCRFCGADARAGRPAGGVSVGLEIRLSDDQIRALTIVDELEQLAPALMTWRQLPKATRGPRPDVRPSDRERVDALLAEMNALYVKMFPDG